VIRQPDKHHGIYKQLRNLSLISLSTEGALWRVCSVVYGDAAPGDARQAEAEVGKKNIQGLDSAPGRAGVGN
jgi:hypothetical protein